MALKKDKPDKTGIEKVADCVKQESTNKAKSVRKKYSAKKTEFKVRKRTIQKATAQNTIVKTSNSENNTQQYNLEPPSVPSVAMFYPPCPQYYPITTNEWSPLISNVQCPVYSLQPIPVIVNPQMVSTQICPYLPVAVPPVTVANEYPVSPLVSVNDLALHVTKVSPIVTSIPNEPSPVYCELSPLVPNLSNGFPNLAVCNEVALVGTPLNSYSSLAAQLSNNVTPAVTPMPNEFSLASYEFSPMSDVFLPIQNIQVPNEFKPICNNVAYEVSPPTTCSYESFSCEYYECDPTTNIFDKNIPDLDIQEYYIENPLEYFLSLPKDLFPTARMMTIDPNSIIDEFCRVPNLDDCSWILDLEFGVPKTPVTRRVATYNVKLNSINCKNAPEAIHPGFESCDKDLKRALMFYYDCVISNWYTGYIALSTDRSVENFQTWLLIPMQVLGMCWA